MALRILRIAAATAIFAFVLVAQSAGAAHAATVPGDVVQSPIPADELPPIDPTGLTEPLPALDPPSGVDLPPVPATIPPTPADDTLSELPLPDPVPDESPPPSDPTPEPPSGDGGPLEPPAEVPAPPEIDVPPSDIAGDGSCCAAPPVDPPTAPPTPDPEPPAPPASPPGPAPSPPVPAGSPPAPAEAGSEATGPDDRPESTGPTATVGRQTGPAPAVKTSRDADDPISAITAAEREAAAPTGLAATAHISRRADPGHAPRRAAPGAGPSIDAAALASAGIAAGLAVVHRAPAGVTIAMEFGRVGGGWAGAIVFNLWLRRQLSARRMSQRQLAALSGVDHTTISRLLRQDRHPSLSTATKIVHALRGVSTDAAEPATAEYFDRLPEETIFPARRVELALRADEQLDDDQVRRLMTLYLHARRRSAMARGDPSSDEREQAARISRR